MSKNKPSLKEIMTSAAKIEKHMKDAHQELNKITVTGSSGDDMVTVCMSGRHDVLSVSIDDSLMQLEQKSLLETLLATAVNNAVLNVEAATQEKILSLAASMNLSDTLLTDESHTENNAKT